MADFYAKYPSSASGGSNASVGVNGATAPTSSTEVGGINGGGLLTPISVDNAGNQNVNVVSSTLPTGSATAANQVLEIAQLTGIHADTTSLDGKTVHVDTGNVIVVASALPTGAATAALQSTANTSLATIVSDLTNGTQVTQITGTVPLPTGSATAANQATEIASLSSIDSKLTSPLTVTGPLTDTQLRASAVPVSLASSPLPTGAATAANQATEIASLASIDTKLTAPLSTTEITSTSSAVTSVNGSASSVSLLALNAARKNAAFYNESTAILYLKLGTTASTTSYTVQIGAGGYYELPVGKIYSGAIDGIWASATGAVRITELS